MQRTGAHLYFEFAADFVLYYSHDFHSPACLQWRQHPPQNSHRRKQTRRCGIAAQRWRFTVRAVSGHGPAMHSTRLSRWRLGQTGSSNDVRALSRQLCSRCTEPLHYNKVVLELQLFIEHTHTQATNRKSQRDSKRAVSAALSSAAASMSPSSDACAWEAALMSLNWEVPVPEVMVGMGGE
jgi:hypothetical protein